MKYGGKALMSFMMIIISVGILVNSLKWPIRTALFPAIISIASFLLFGAELYIALSGKGESGQKGAATDVTFSEDIDRSIANRRAFEFFLWIVSFALLILLLGFSMAVPLFVFSYLKFYGKEKWGISLLLAGMSWGFFYGLFVWLLHTTIAEGLVFEGIRRLGIR